MLYFPTKIDFFLSLKMVQALANSVDFDGMPHTVAFHLCLLCLSNYPFRNFQ